MRVEIGEYKSQSVIVSGEVRQPGKITMTGAMTLLEALAAAGSPHPSASSELTVAHPKQAGRQTDDPKSSRINWKDLQLGKGSDVVLQDGDIINVPKAQTFFITGQVRNAGSATCSSPARPSSRRSRWPAASPSAAPTAASRSRASCNGKSTDVKVTLEDKVQPNDTITVRNRFF